jgi:hypothetical protein
LISSAQISSEQVVIECPACGAAESVDPSMLLQHPAMVCRDCGETWPVEDLEARHNRALAEKLAPRRLDSPRPTQPLRRAERLQGEILVAEKRPLVTYSNSKDDTWAGKIAGDYWPEPPRHSRIPMVAAGIAALFFLAAFFGGREAAVAALPDLAGLYAAIGLPVNLDGLEIQDVRAARVPTFSGDRLAVQATIRNVGSTKQAIPPLAAVLYNSALAPSGAYSFDPPSEKIAAGQEITLTMNLEGASLDAAEVIVRFRRRGETLPVAGAAESLTP